MSGDPWSQAFATPAPNPLAAAIPAHILTRLKTCGFPQDRDGVLMMHQASKQAITDAQADEMELRKLVVALFVEAPKEGMNNVDLGNGFTLKAGIKFNYNLRCPAGKKDVIEAVDDVIDRFAQLDNEGPFIAERLFKWKVDMSVAEYRKLVEDAKTSATKTALVKELETVLEITDAAPTLEIKEPKGKK